MVLHRTSVRPKLAKVLLVVWQSSIARLIQIDSPSRNGLWFAEKEISHGQISCHPHG